MADGLEVTLKKPSQGQGIPGSVRQLGSQPASQPGGQVPPQGTLTPDEVVTLSREGITSVQGRWIKAEITSQGYNLVYVDPRVELRQIQDACVMAAVDDQMVNARCNYISYNSVSSPLRALLCIFRSMFYLILYSSSKPVFDTINWLFNRFSSEILPVAQRQKEYERILNST